MSNKTNKPIGRPKNTGCVEVSVDELYETFGGSVMVPVKYTWHRDKMKDVVGQVVQPVKNSVDNSDSEDTVEETEEEAVEVTLQA